MEIINENTIAYFISKQKLTHRIEILNTLVRTNKNKVLQSFEELILKLFKISFNNDIFKKINFELDKYHLDGINYISFLSNSFPRELLNIDDFPSILFFKGNLGTLQKTKKVSIVGSRKANLEGKEIAYNIASTLAKLNVVIVSGLAYGIDAMSHKGAISNNKKHSTIAVLGNGLNSIYPKLNKKLSEEIIINQGLILSQFPPSMKPLPHNFLNRNRIIAALSELTLVVQAQEKSGSLVTARYASEYGKIVTAIPGGVKNSLYSGCNKIIKNGGYLIESSNDLTELLEIELNEKDSIENNDIIKILNTNGKMNLKEIQNCLDRKTDLQNELLELEIENRIKRLPGNYFAINLI